MKGPQRPKIIPDVLPSGDVCPFPQRTTPLSDWELLTLKDGEELLRVLRVVSKRFSLKQLDLHSQLRETIAFEEAIAFYQRMGASTRRRSFFEPPAELPQVCLSASAEIPFGEVVDIMFESHFAPKFPPFAPQFEELNENRKVHARWWRHTHEPSRGTVFAIHGWLFGDQRMNALTLMPGFFYRLGLDVILYELPYHGRRRPAQAGTDLLFPSGNLPLTNEAFAQSIFELRALRGWVAQETNSNKVGAIGMSLGGYTAALWAGLDRLDFVIPVVPLVSLPDFVHSVATELSSSLELSSPRLLEQIYRVHSPLRFRPKVSRAGRLIIAARDDRILPPTHALALSNHWDQTEILWLEGGHLDQLTASIALNRIHQLLLSLGLAEREPFRMEF